MIFVTGREFTAALQTKSLKVSQELPPSLLLPALGHPVVSRLGEEINDVEEGRVMGADEEDALVTVKGLDLGDNVVGEDGVANQSAGERGRCEGRTSGRGEVGGPVREVLGMGRRMDLGEYLARQRDRV